MAAIDEWRKDERFVVLSNELLDSEGPRGEVSCDPGDPGGLTRWGISSRAYPDIDVRNLSRDGALEIYYRDWWVRRRVGEIEWDDLAGEVLDLIVTNPSEIVKALQRAVPRSGGRTVTVDGILGDDTLAAVNDHPNGGWLIDRFRIEVIKFYRGLNRSRFLASWVARALA